MHLKKNTKYEGYTSDSPTENLINIDEKRKLLYFVTSSPHFSIGGLGGVPFIIAKDGYKVHALFFLMIKMKMKCLRKLTMFPAQMSERSTNKCLKNIYSNLKNI